MKKGKHIGFVVLVMSVVLTLFSTFASATVFTGKFDTNKLTYAFAGSYSTATINTLSNHIEKWDSASTKFSMSKTSSYNSARIKVEYALNKPPSVGDLGLTLLYKSNGQSVLDPTKKGSWHSAIVKVYKDSAASTTNKHATLIHEVGHSLSMAHCFHPGMNHIMHQGLKNYTIISSYEKQELNLRWGGNS